MPSAIWKGAITFGLVYVPVEVFAATQSERTGFNLLDRRTLAGQIMRARRPRNARRSADGARRDVRGCGAE